jgi:hypothetical protein
MAHGRQSDTGLLRKPDQFGSTKATVSVGAANAASADIVLQELYSLLSSGSVDDTGMSYLPLSLDDNLALTMAEQALLDRKLRSRKK